MGLTTLGDFIVKLSMIIFYGQICEKVLDLPIK